MNYTLRIAGQDIPIEADIADDHAIKATINGRDVIGDFRIISTNQIHLEIDGIGINAYLTDDHEGKLINVSGITYLVQDVEALTQNGPKRSTLKELPQVVTPPMPSVVVRIMIAEGDEVEKGQGVVVVSAMKMETTLQAPFKGKVLKINVAEGEKVMPGQVLVDIERAEEEGKDAD